MDYSQNNGFYSLPELFIINKVVELCYSELISYESFQKFTNTCKIKLLNNEASVLEKAAWISNRYSNFLLEASNWTEIDPINYYFSDEPASASDLLKSEYKELASVDINLEHQSSPVNNELFWDNLIYSKAQKIEFMFDYYKYIDIDSSIHSIKDIINLFDQKAMFGQLENTESFRLDKEELWTAMIYDAIYYTYINVSLLNCNEKYQTSFKMMCKQFYEQYASPVISENAQVQ